MEFELTHYKKFKKHLIEMAKKFGLDPDKLKIEFFTPNRQAILVENVENQQYKIHINLEEDRIISIQRLSGEGVYPEHIRKKYRQFMK